MCKPAAFSKDRFFVWEAGRQARFKETHTKRGRPQAGAIPQGQSRYSSSDAMSRPQASIATFFDTAVPIEEQIPLVAEAGFSHLSLAGKESHSNFLSAQGRGRLVELLQEHNLSIDTIHGPQTDRPDSADQLSAVANAARKLSAPIVVMHASSWNFPAQELSERLEAVLKRCSLLKPVAKDTGVRFAIENVMPRPATAIVPRVLEQLDPSYFGFSYDSSQDQIGGLRAFDLLESLRGC